MPFFLKFLCLVIYVGNCDCGWIDPFHTQFDDIEPALLFEAKQKTPASSTIDHLLVMTWNIKFGGGRIGFFFECDGERSLMKKVEVKRNLQALAEKINQVNPDILLIQEIDIKSKRSAYINQIQWLLNHTELNYAAYASQWKADFVPSDGMGRINSGNAIFSRWTFSRAERLALPTDESQDAITEYFYLKRNILRAFVKLPQIFDLVVLNTHTSAFTQDNIKKRQLDVLAGEMNQLHKQSFQIIAGGDFNTIPRDSVIRSNFIDSCQNDRFAADDYNGEEAFLDFFYANFTPAIAHYHYASNNRSFFTYGADANKGWTRKLDYLFTNVSFRAHSELVHQNQIQGELETLSRSDHAPLSAEMIVLQ